MRDDWHARSIDEVLSALDVDLSRGLSGGEVGRRREEYGTNALPRKRAPSPLVIFFRQFKNPLIFILAAAGIVTFLFAERTDGLVIWAAVLLNAGVGFVQERKAGRALEELEAAVDVSASVVRDGERRIVDEEDIVPGDVVVIEEGDKIPADVRIAESDGLQINEAVLTGEWIPSHKSEQEVDVGTPLADRSNMAYLGTTVAVGRGIGVVVATGMRTELGDIAGLIGGIGERVTPYQRRLARFSWLLSLVIGVIAGALFVDGIVSGISISEMFTLAVAVAVAAIPEGLPVSVTAILAVGMRRILAERGVVRHLTSAETLGSVSVIATDKTLTLTEGRMALQRVVSYRGYRTRSILSAAALANNAFAEGRSGIIRGTPTDGALFRAARDAGIERSALEKKEPLVRRYPFDAARGYTLAVHRKGGALVGYLAGAPEALIEAASNIDAPSRERLRAQIGKLAVGGLRVIGVGTATVTDLDNGVNGLSFMGLVALRDPVRPGAAEAIGKARGAGIRVIMITGDHVGTALAVAEEVGIVPDRNGGPERARSMTGEELDGLADRELDERVLDVKVYARVEPRHKLRIVEAWQRRGDVIAMTGDGVNDAPALKRADIGIALGSGTDVAKETSDLILLGDEFSIIPLAVREGRVLADNVRRVITYLLSSAFSEVMLVGLAMMFGLPLPLLAVQILWVNIVEDALPGIAFMFERGATDVMRRKPEPRHTPLVNKEMRGIITAITLVANVTLFALFSYLLHHGFDIAHARTFIFGAIAIDSLMFVFSCRDLGKNLWEYNPFSNRYLNISVLTGFALIASAMYIPFFQDLLHTVPLTAGDWVLLAGFGFLNVVLIETVKFFRK